MNSTEKWLVSWFAARHDLDAAAGGEVLRIDYFDAQLIDSFGVIELIADVEATFGIQFEHLHFEDRRFRTIGGLSEIVREIASRAGLIDPNATN
jgi:D-alanine--poly(phosphoribitol) ligase subunit 2